MKTEMLYMDERIPSQERAKPLRFVAWGGADDGKSTLIGRVLRDTNRLCEIPSTSGRDGYASAITAAKAADVGVMLIDARKGVLEHARRYSYLAYLAGVRNVVLAVNKIDLVGHSREVFERIQDDYRAFVEKLNLHNTVCIPVSALHGDNVAARSTRTPWYGGPTLTEYLERTELGGNASAAPFRFLVESLDGQRFSGRAVGGTVRRGDRVRVLPGGKETTINRVVGKHGDLDIAVAGEPTILTLADEVDIRAGDMITAADAPAEVADQFQADVVWMGSEPMLPGRPYRMKIGAKTIGATITKPKYKVNVDTLEHLAATTLEMGEIGVCNLHLDEAVPFDPYKENRETGSFVLIDPITDATLAVGFLHFALRRSQNIHWQAIEVNKNAHAALKEQRPCIVWFTGLSGAGKSTIANLVEKKLHALGRHTYLLDGDNVRHGLNKDLGFTEADRVENIRRVAEVAKLMVDAGLIVLVSFISPFRAERRMARSLVQQDEFCEVFVDVPLEVAEQRDRKGLYKKARRGELKNFTGIDSPYEAPEDPEIRLDTARRSAEESAERIVSHLQAAGVLRG